MLSCDLFLESVLLVRVLVGVVDVELVLEQALGQELRPRAVSTISQRCCTLSCNNDWGMMVVIGERESFGEVDGRETILRGAMWVDWRGPKDLLRGEGARGWWPMLTPFVIMLRCVEKFDEEMKWRRK